MDPKNNTTMKYIARIFRIQAILAVAAITGGLTSCKEDIDTEWTFTAKEPTILEYLEEGEHAENFTEYVQLLQVVPISRQSSSSVAQLLSARGHYTCFAPDNQAIYDYLSELHEKGIISEPTWNGFDTEEKLDSIRRVIVLNSVLDGTNNETVLEMGDISSQDDDQEFLLPNLNDRKLKKKKDPDNPDYIYMNGVALIDLNNRDIKCLNGRIHEVHGVIAPTNDTMADIFREMIAESQKGFSVMAKLILACGLDDTLTKTRDYVWEDKVLNKEVQDLALHPTEQIGSIPLYRKYGFTIFAEPDALWEREIGKTYDQITVEDIKTYLIDRGAYPTARQDNDYTSEDNIINQFVTYHMLPEKLTPGRLVIHYNELGYYWKTSDLEYTIPVYEYYTTMGKRRLLKIYQSKESADEDPERRGDNMDGIYLNRFPILRNGRGEDSNPNDPNYNDYHESGRFREPGTAATFLMKTDTRTNENVGVKVRMEAEDEAKHQNLEYSCIYPLQEVLVYTENVQNRLAGERIRIDMAAMFPEMINNDIRRPLANYPDGSTQTKGFPVEYPYLADVQMRDGTLFYYFTGHDRGWSNYQMDEFNIIGKYEFTMKLPPVPKKGHYEIRFGVSSGSSWRSMCQVYFGDNISYLPAKDIPMDLRIGFYRHRFRNGNQTSNFGYTGDTEYQNEAKLTLEEQDEITKNLRARGFMKGPKYFHIGNGTTALNGQQGEWVTRRIMVSEDMDPDKTYYIRFKNVLNDDQLQFFMDYFEFVSKDVYDNPVEPEDIW